MKEAEGGVFMTQSRGDLQRRVRTETRGRSGCARGFHLGWRKNNKVASREPIGVPVGKSWPTPTRSQDSL